MGFKFLNEKQKKYISELRDKGLTWKEVNDKFEEKFGWRISKPTVYKYQDYGSEKEEEEEEEVDKSEKKKEQEPKRVVPSRVKVEGSDTRTKKPEKSKKSKKKKVVDLRRYSFKDKENEAKRQRALENGLYFLDLESEEVYRNDPRSGD